jgi:AraC-like DNA-binding protein
MALLSTLISTRLLPLARRQEGVRLIVARAEMKQSQLPDEIKLETCSIEGRRAIVRNRREYDNVRNLKAVWPQAGLEEWETPRLICIVQGSLVLQAARFVFECPAGTHLFVPAGVPLGWKFPQREKSREKAHSEVVNLMLHPQAVQCFITRAWEEQEKVECVENYIFKNLRLSRLLQYIIEEADEGRESHQRVGTDLLCAFWEIMAREVREGHYTTPGPVGRPLDAQTELQGTDFQAELLAYLQQHINQPLSLESAARAMYLSRSQFVRRMQRETGKTFVQFLTDYRMQEAKSLLRDSDWTIAAIAEFLGFRSSNYFQVVFRRANGISPHKFRLRSREE